MLKSLLLDDIKVNITIDDIRLRSKLSNNETIRFTEKNLFYTIFGFSENQSGPLSDIEELVQSIPGTY